MRSALADFFAGRRPAGPDVPAPLGRDARPLRRIAVFRALHLGDLLCTVPALRALRVAAPLARITLIGLPWAQSFVDRYREYVDELMVFPGYPGFPEGPASLDALRRFQHEAQTRRFDLAIQLHGSGEQVNGIVRGFGARQTAGFFPANQYRPGPAFLPWPQSGSEIHRYLQLMDALGAPESGSQLEFPLTEADRSDAAALLARHNLAAGAYVCVHPGARLASRRWPITHFAAVVRMLVRDGWPVLLTGAGGETMLTRRLLDEALEPGLRAMVVDVAGLTSLGGLAALLAQARLLVSNDTGVSHIAAAMATPSVIISSGGDARRWAPLDARRHQVLFHDLPCRPCAHADCPIGHPCALGVQPAAVIEAARAALQASARHAA